MGELQTGVAATLKATLSKLHKMATGIVPEGYRLHRDFAFTFNGWHINAHAKREGLTPELDAQKVRILFEDADMKRFDDCPYMARMGYSMDLTREHRFCAFLYPRAGETVDEIQAWAAEKGFAHVSVLNKRPLLKPWDQAHRLEALG